MALVASALLDSLTNAFDRSVPRADANEAGGLPTMTFLCSQLAEGL